MKYMVEDLLMESGRFWCVYEAVDARAGRMVRAFLESDGDAKGNAEKLAREMNEEAA